MSRRLVLLLLCNFQAGKLLNHWFTRCCPAHIVAGRTKCLPKHNTEKRLSEISSLEFVPIIGTRQKIIEVNQRVMIPLISFDTGSQTG